MKFEKLKLSEVPLGISYSTAGLRGMILGVFTEIEEYNGQYILRWEFPFNDEERDGRNTFESLSATVGLNSLDFTVIEEVSDVVKFVDDLMSLLATA